MRGPRPGLLAASVVLAVIVVVAILAPWISPDDAFAQHLAQRRIPPVWHAWLWNDPHAGWAHPLGTDKVGRDTLSRLMLGARISLLVGGVTAAASTVIGGVLGTVAGYWGGRVDMAASFLIQARLALPIILVALTTIAVFGGSLATLVVVLSLLLWDRAAVMTRSATSQLRTLDFVQAARALGCSDLRIILTGILPNLVGGLAVIATIELGNAVLLEAALSFLGLGVRPPSPSWGLMLAEGKDDIFFAPWAITIPGTALFLLVLSTSIIGDALQARDCQ
jgi:peptide/nickel transport system permease protein